MKKYFLILLCALFPHISHAKSGFEYFGDSMQVLPFVMMAYSYYIDDMQGVKEQALGAGATLLTTHAIKQGFVILSRSDEDLARISQRPNNGSFDGFPSGHTSFSFSSVGFAHKRYGWKVALPLGVLSTLTGISRIHAERHTTTQVITGAILGYGLSYLLASKLESQNIALSVGITPHNGYTLNFIKAF
ncbi:PAP2 family protein [Helicobacter sp. MIT 00-7814]|uniref:phosphatase PAP2 family protein n=1 Tax=unclassified Helicobacter TaxID=2593540 RepID=UPI000E1EC5A7|nr:MULTISPECIES: phosphatase PAP2 family protein [unclassified Helicobacter]RDU57227.1 PAP2 family protein [Helicobacter sp. MIT 00-7814]RDU57779.1 PAP2 family protein [Helicobacter sp. MIT 99-10781]